MQVRLPWTKIDCMHSNILSSLGHSSQFQYGDDDKDNTNAD